MGLGGLIRAYRVPFDEARENTANLTHLQANVYECFRAGYAIAQVQAQKGNFVPRRALDFGVLVCTAFGHDLYPRMQEHVDSIPETLPEDKPMIRYVPRR